MKLALTILFLIPNCLTKSSIKTKSHHHGRKSKTYLTAIETKTAIFPPKAELGPYGNLQIGICVEKGERCCFISNLDNPGFVNDFQLGATDYFRKKTLGQCENFEMPGIDIQIGIENWHTPGHYSDGWQGDYIRLHLSNGRYFECYLKVYLQDTSRDVSKSCSMKM